MLFLVHAEFYTYQNLPNMELKKHAANYFLSLGKSDPKDLGLLSALCLRCFTFDVQQQEDWVKQDNGIGCFHKPSAFKSKF